jgi:putative hydrolase of the HAD superfamily
VQQEAVPVEQGLARADSDDWRPLEAVVFDWGGTLSVWAQVEYELMWREVARRLAPEEEELLIKQLVDAELKFWRGVEESQRSGDLQTLIATATAELGLDVTEALLAEAVDHHLGAWSDHVVHDPDATGVLEELRDRGLKLGLLSNTLWPGRHHERFLERDGLKDLIDVRLYTSEMEYTKPHPEVFRAVLEALGVSDAERAVFVGDRPFDDIFGAKRAGLRAVLRPNPYTPNFDVEPDAVISDLPALLPIVDDWSGPARDGARGCNA